MIRMKVSTAWILWSSLLMAFLFMAGYIMGNAADSLNKVASDPSCAIPLDLQIFETTVEEASHALNCMGTAGRKIYHTVETREDILYPIIYSLFFSFTLLRLSSFCIQNTNAVLSITLLPFAAMTADFIENHHITTLINQFPALDPKAISAYSLANSVKWSLLFTIFFLTALFSLWSSVKLIRGKSVQERN